MKTQWSEVKLWSYCKSGALSIVTSAQSKTGDFSESRSNAVGVRDFSERFMVLAARLSAVVKTKLAQLQKLLWASFQS